MAKAERERPGRRGTKAAVAHDECQRRLATRQAGVLQRRPLIKTGGDQQNAAEHVACALHHRRQQRGAIQRPLRRRRNERKRGPRQQVTCGKPGAGGERLALRDGLPPDTGVEQDHRRRRRRHHPDHHHRPHQKDVTELERLPRRVCRHHPAAARRNHAEAGHIHAAHRHVVGEPEQIGPGEQGDRRQCSEDNKAVAAQHRFKRRAGHRRIFTGYLTMPLWQRLTWANCP